MYKGEKREDFGGSRDSRGTRGSRESGDLRESDLGWWIGSVVCVMLLSGLILFGWLNVYVMGVLAMLSFGFLGYMLIRITREYVYEEAGRVSEGFVRKLMDVTGVLLILIGIGMGVIIWVM